MKVKMEYSIISRLIPQRYPFLMLDKVVELIPGKSAVGIKNVTINELYFCGHFPQSPVVPGVLLIESLAQLASVMYAVCGFPEDTDWSHMSASDLDAMSIQEKIGYLVEVKNIKFKRMVKPGDTLTLRVFNKSTVRNMSIVKIDALVNENTVMEGTIGVAQNPAE